MIVQYEDYSIEITGDEEGITGIKVDGVSVPVDFISEVATDFYEWCEEKFDCGGMFEDNPFFEKQEDEQ